MQAPVTTPEFWIIILQFGEKANTLSISAASFLMNMDKGNHHQGWYKQMADLWLIRDNTRSKIKYQLKRRILDSNLEYQQIS